MYDKLKRTPPKDMQSNDEIEQVLDGILPVIKPHVIEFVKFREASMAISDSFIKKQVSEEDANKKITELKGESLKYELDKGNEIIDVDFEKQPFATLFQLFERWGKEWLGTIEDFSELRKAMTATNTKPVE
jgi:hypothetical protein